MGTALLHLKCGKRWTYEGDSKHYVTCPECKTSFKLTYGIVARKSDGRCEDCGSSENLEIHHKKSKFDGGNDDVENLSVLCERCHRKRVIRNRTASDRKIIQINVTFEDVEHYKLLEKKGKLSWHDFIMKLADENDSVISQSKIGDGE